MRFLSEEEVFECYKAAATADKYGGFEDWQDVLDRDETMEILGKFDALPKDEQEKFERDLKKVVIDNREDFSSLPDSTNEEEDYNKFMEIMKILRGNAVSEMHEYIEY